MMKPKCMIGLSGGLDSGVLLGTLVKLDAYDDIQPVYLRYGSKNEIHEESAARDLTRFYGLGLLHVDLRPLFMLTGHSNPLLVSGPPMPKGGHDDPAMKATVIPARNLVFIAALTHIALTKNFDAVALGIQTERGKTLYPDCSPQFMEHAQSTVSVVSDNRLAFIAPFADTRKQDIVGAGLDMGFPFHLTRTCWQPTPHPCGQCGACNKRLAAFKAVGGMDPLEYRRSG